MERTRIREVTIPVGVNASAPVRRRCLNCRQLLYEQAQEYPTARTKPWLCGKCRGLFAALV